MHLIEVIEGQGGYQHHEEPSSRDHAWTQQTSYDVFAYLDEQTTDWHKDTGILKPSCQQDKN